MKIDRPLNTKLKGLTGEINSATELCNGIFTWIGSNYFVPFKCKFGSSIHPTGTTGWIKGIILLQNTDYNYNEIGSIYATTANTTYFGYILVTNSIPVIQWFDLNQRIQNTDDWIENKLRSNEGNIYFRPVGNYSYGYLTLEAGNNPTTGTSRPPRLINAYISEIDDHVDWRMDGFVRNTQTSTQSTYTLWTNFSFTGNVWCQWTYMLI